MVVTPQIMLQATARELSVCGIIAMVTVVILVVARELARVSDVSRFKLLSRNLDAVIVPLSIVFVFILITKVLDIIG
jgi:hypothetical protein